MTDDRQPEIRFERTPIAELAGIVLDAARVSRGYVQDGVGAGQVHGLELRTRLDLLVAAAEVLERRLSEEDRTR